MLDTYVPICYLREYTYRSDIHNYFIIRVMSIANADFRTIFIAIADFGTISIANADLDRSSIGTNASCLLIIFHTIHEYDGMFNRNSASIPSRWILIRCILHTVREDWG
jgi:hypothetical protein